jgi:hypothetical protein
MVTVTLTTSPAFRVLAAMPVALLMATLLTVGDVVSGETGMVVLPGICCRGDFSGGGPCCNARQSTQLLKRRRKGARESKQI